MCIGGVGVVGVGRRDDGGDGSGRQEKTPGLLSWLRPALGQVGVSALHLLAGQEQGQLGVGSVFGCWVNLLHKEREQGFQGVHQY